MRRPRVARGSDFVYATRRGLGKDETIEYARDMAFWRTVAYARIDIHGVRGEKLREGSGYPALGASDLDARLLGTMPPDVKEDPETTAGGSLRDPGEKCTTSNAEDEDSAEKKEDGKGEWGMFSKCVCM